MRKIKTSTLVITTISLLLLGILLPIGLSDLLDFSNEVESTSQTINGESTATNYTRNLRYNEQLNVSVHYDSSGDDLLVLSAYNSTYNVEATDNTDANDISIQFNSSLKGTNTFTIEVKNTTAGSVDFNITIRTNFLTQIDENTITLVKEVIPIVAVISIVLGFVYKSKYD